MLRAEVFTVNPGKMTVTWFDFSLLCFDVVARYELLMDLLNKDPHSLSTFERTGVRKIHTKKRKDALLLLNRFTEIYEIINNDEYRYNLFLEHDIENFTILLKAVQILNECAKELKIDLNIEFEDDDVETCFDAWFRKHGKDFEKGG